MMAAPSGRPPPQRGHLLIQHRFPTRPSSKSKVGSSPNEERDDVLLVRTPNRYLVDPLIARSVG
ncbi:hypothetical protein BA895_22555 [Humibacillus sp. DSM 29435]|nr:hypothetical protein BA895_22555 [Humibacillus sp. DSM 29435]